MYTYHWGPPLGYLLQLSVVVILPFKQFPYVWGDSLIRDRLH